MPAEYSLKLGLGPETFTVLLDGIPEMMFGCPDGRPWMLSSPVPMSPKWRRTFLRLTREAVDLWNEHYPVLHNFIDARNETHIRWLKWMGFVFFARHERWGPKGLPFYEFARINPQCVQYRSP